MAVRRAFTERAHGDLRVGLDPETLAPRRAAVADHPWVWLHQVHGATVITVGGDDPAGAAGAEADALVTATPGVVLAIHTADCVPVLLTSPDGVIGAVHAGWKGLAAGVLAGTVDAMRALGATEIDVELGPFIHPECYEFGADDLARLSGVLDADVGGTTDAGQPALDLELAVLAGLRGTGVRSFAGLAADLGPGCTACSPDRSGAPRWFSHRARAEVERQASIIWIEP